MKLIDPKHFAGVILMTMKKDFTLIGMIIAKWLKDNGHVDYAPDAAGVHLLQVLRSTLANWPARSGDFDPDDECSTDYVDACLTFVKTIHESGQGWPVVQNLQGKLEPLLPSKVAEELVKELNAADMDSFREVMLAITRAIAANSPYGDKRRAGLASDGQPVAHHAAVLMGETGIPM